MIGFSFDSGRGARRAFTLIEVIVATAVLSIMVLMIGGVFQQASSSWDSGYARAEGGMAVRAAVGSLTRDLATAVDGRRFGLSKPIEVEGTRITMYRLVPGPDNGNRDIEKVVYSGGSDSFERNGKAIYSPPKNGSAYHARFSFAAGPETDATKNSSTLRPYESGTAFAGQIAWTIPYVKIRCELTRTGTFSGLTVRSLGRDGVENGDSNSQDDIIVR